MKDQLSLTLLVVVALLVARRLTLASRVVVLGSRERGYP